MNHKFIYLLGISVSDLMKPLLKRKFKNNESIKRKRNRRKKKKEGRRMEKWIKRKDKGKGRKTFNTVVDELDPISNEGKTRITLIHLKVLTLLLGNRNQDIILFELLLHLLSILDCFIILFDTIKKSISNNRSTCGIIFLSISFKFQSFWIFFFTILWNYIS